MNLDHDYNCFIKESQSLLSELREHETMTFDLFVPVLMVLEYIKQNNFEIEDLTQEESEELFRIGYTYLYDSINVIKNLLNDAFDGDIEELIEFDENIYLLTRVNDSDLDSDISDYLYDLTSKKVSIPQDKVESIEKALDELSDSDELYATTDRFADILDALGISLL